MLVAGGTGTLGRQLVPLLSQAGLRVRVLSRNPVRAGSLTRNRVEVVAGDVTDPATLGGALDEVDTVVAAMSGYGPQSGGDPRSVDWVGNRNLIQAAKRARVASYVLVSALGAAPNHPMELMRMKSRAEQELVKSGLACTIVRPALYMETLVDVMGPQLLRSGRAVIAGRGENSINFVSASDVAHLVERAVLDTTLRGSEIEIGGPENLTLKQFAAKFAAARGTECNRVHVPRTALRLVALLSKPIKPSVARLAHDLVVMDTYDFKFDPAPFRDRYPWATLTTLTEVLAGLRR